MIWISAIAIYSEYNRLRLCISKLEDSIHIYIIVSWIHIFHVSVGLHIKFQSDFLGIIVIKGHN